MKNSSSTTFSFPDSARAGIRRSLRRDLQNALRFSESPVILDLSGHHTLDHQDVELLLDCVAQATGRDTPLFLVAGSRVIHVLLDLIRISSLVPVFDSIEKAVGHAKTTTLVRVSPDARDFLPTQRSA